VERAVVELAVESHPLVERERGVEGPDLAHEVITAGHTSGEAHIKSVLG
jgi:hypothetical protein